MDLVYFSFVSNNIETNVIVAYGMVGYSISYSDYTKSLFSEIIFVRPEYCNIKNKILPHLSKLLIPTLQMLKTSVIIKRDLNIIFNFLRNDNVCNDDTSRFIFKIIRDKFSINVTILKIDIIDVYHLSEQRYKYTIRLVLLIDNFNISELNNINLQLNLFEQQEQNIFKL